MNTAADRSKKLVFIELTWNHSRFHLAGSLLDTGDLLQQTQRIYSPVRAVTF